MDRMIVFLEITRKEKYNLWRGFSLHLEIWILIMELLRANKTIVLGKILEGGNKYI
jgi:hypothetical protein